MWNFLFLTWKLYVVSVCIFRYLKSASAVYVCQYSVYEIPYSLYGGCIGEFFFLYFNFKAVWGCIFCYFEALPGLYAAVWAPLLSAWWFYEWHLLIFNLKAVCGMYLCIVVNFKPVWGLYGCPYSFCACCVILCFFFHFKVLVGAISVIFWESKPIWDVYGWAYSLYDHPYSLYGGCRVQICWSLTWHLLGDCNLCIYVYCNLFWGAVWEPIQSTRGVCDEIVFIFTSNVYVVCIFVFVSLL